VLLSLKENDKTLDAALKSVGASAPDCLSARRQYITAFNAIGPRGGRGATRVAEDRAVPVPGERVVVVPIAQKHATFAGFGDPA